MLPPSARRVRVRAREETGVGSARLPDMRRITFLLVLILALIVATGCGQYGKRYVSDTDDTAVTGEEPRITEDDFEDEKVRTADGCGELEEFKSEGRGHTTDLNEKVEYQHNPPHSGSHYQLASEWGLYDEQQPDVQTVHNLEHGHIVISHKGLKEPQVKELLDTARINPFHLLVQPRKDNPKNGVYYTVWTKQIHCKQPSEAALQFLIDNWRDQGPELFTDDPSKMMS